MQTKNQHVFDKKGLRGTIVAYPTVESVNKHILIELEDGRKIGLTSDMLIRRNETTFDTNVIFSDFENAGSKKISSNLNNQETLTIPVIQEVLDIQKELVETEVFRINKTVTERDELIEHLLSKENADIERLAVGREVSETRPSYYENETLVIPLYEEIMVVEKRIILREEIRITMNNKEEHYQQKVTLRTEEATIERVKQ